MGKAESGWVQRVGSGLIVCPLPKSAGRPAASVVYVLTQRVPLGKIDVGLIQDAAQGSDRNFVLPRHDGRVDGIAESPHELDVAALLAGFDKSRRLKTPLDFTERLRTKPRQPQPLPCEPWEYASLAALQSKVPTLPSSCPAPRLRSRLGWRHRLPDTERHTTLLRTKR